MRALLLSLAMGLAAAPAWAAEISVTIRDAKGKPVPDAVVTLHPPTPAAMTIGGPYRMIQKDMKFAPFVMVVPRGATVAFPNLDPVLHHVYSYSAPHPFELKLFGKDESRSVKFDKAGVIAVGCNIHDAMIAFIKVVDTPYAAKADATGVARLSGLPAGPAEMRVWHPYLRGANNELTRRVSLGAAPAAEQVKIELRPPPVHTGGY